MKAIIGLGNPGPKYETTRHNAGFLILDEIVHNQQLSWKKKFNGEICKAVIHGQECILLKPLTFMNVSGRSVGQMLKFFKISPTDMTVIHDDIDMPISKVKAKVGGGHGGHNGIRSIMDTIGNRDFDRIKIGVGRPAGKQPVKNWVLAQFDDDELLAFQNELYQAILIRLEGIFQRK